MSPIARRVISAVLAGCIGLIASIHAAGQQRAPATVTRLYSTPDGESHVEKIDVKLAPSATYADTEASEAVKVTGAQFFRLPKGRVQDWHHPTRRQYVVTISGRGEVELSGGGKIVFEPGQVVLAEDLTGKGHITRSVGSEDLILFIVPLAVQ